MERGRRGLPPPAYEDASFDGDRIMTDSTASATLYAVYQIHQAAGASSAQPHTVATHASAHAVSHVYLLDVRLRRWVFVARIPKKREGWKADVLSISEKEREEARYEVRREPLARKYDFRPPSGMHNVMIPHSAFSTGPKTFSIEAPDGQKLVWRRPGVMKPTVLLSQPSNAVVAQYNAYVQGSHAPPAPLSAMVPCNAEQPAALQGMLSVMPFEHTEPTRQTLKNLARTASRSSSTSSSSSDAGPRLCTGTNRSLAIGLFAPAVISSAVGGPFCAATMNRRCVIGDDLANLGRASVSAPPRVEDGPAPTSTNWDAYGGEGHVSSGAALAEHWASLNRMTSVRKNNDPRPRAVDEDLIVASLMAVLAA